MGLSFLRHYSRTTFFLTSFNYKKKMKKISNFIVKLKAFFFFFFENHRDIISIVLQLGCYSVVSMFSHSVIKE